MKDTLKISEISCLCGGNSFINIYQGIKPFGFSVLKCIRCGICRNSPSPAPASNFFFEDSNNGDLDNKLSESQIKMDRKRFKKICFMIGTKKKSPLYILDIGTKTGQFVHYALEQGLEAFGIDIDAKMIWSAAGEVKARLCIADANNVPFMKCSFDCVNFSHVLEHLERPLQVLSEIRRILKPGGLLVVNVPNYKGLIPRLRPVSWQGWSPETHFWHFAPKTLFALLERMGFKVVNLKLTSLCTPLIRNRVKRVAYNVLSWIGEKWGMGDNILVIAKNSVRNNHSFR